MRMFLAYVLLIPFFFGSVVIFLVELFIPRALRRKKDIKGQRILITGAGSGLGRQLAVEFSRHEVCLILVDIDKPSLLQTEKLLDGRSSVFIYECDVADYKKVYEMARKVREEAGDVDILVNNAGIVAGKYLIDLPEEKIVKTMEVNAIAHFWTCKAFLPAMMKKNSGHLVSIASVMGRCGGPKLVDYCSSKFAAIGLAEALEIEMIEQELDGIKVTIVIPYLMDTGLFRGTKLPIIKAQDPQHVAKEVVLGVREEQEIIYIPGFFRYAYLLKELSPRWLTTRLNKMTGAIKAMDHFTGRQTNDVNSNKPVKTD